MLFEQLYEDNVAGKIGDARFARMSMWYIQEQGEIGAKVKAPAAGAVPDRRKLPEADIIMETRKGVALSYAPAQIAV